MDFLKTDGRLPWRILTATGAWKWFLKNRNGPQLRLLKNVMPRLAPAIAFACKGGRAIATRLVPR